MWRLALAAALAGALIGASGGAGTARAARHTTPVRVTFVGDSVAGALSYLPAVERSLGRGVDLRLDLRVCRRLASAGCPYGGSTPPSALATVHEQGAQVGQVLVVDVGYNDDPALYRSGMDDLIRTAGALGVKRIVWVTLRESRTVYGRTNAVIRNEAARFPQVEIADWNASSAGKPWFRDDGLHLTADGAVALAGWLRPYVVRAAREARVSAAKS
jgi:hypothetical protein